MATRRKMKRKKSVNTDKEVNQCDKKRKNSSSCSSSTTFVLETLKDVRLYNMLKQCNNIVVVGNKKTKLKLNNTNDTQPKNELNSIVSISTDNCSTSSTTTECLLHYPETVLNANLEAANNQGKIILTEYLLSLSKKGDDNVIRTIFSDDKVLLVIKEGVKLKPNDAQQMQGYNIHSSKMFTDRIFNNWFHKTLRNTNVYKETTIEVVTEEDMKQNEPRLQLLHLKGVLSEKASIGQRCIALAQLRTKSHMKREVFDYNMNDPTKHHCSSIKTFIKEETEENFFDPAIPYIRQYYDEVTNIYNKHAYKFMDKHTQRLFLERKDSSNTYDNKKKVAINIKHPGSTPAKSDWICDMGIHEDDPSMFPTALTSCNPFVDEREYHGGHLCLIEGGIIVPHNDDKDVVLMNGSKLHCVTGMYSRPNAKGCTRVSIAHYTDSEIDGGSYLTSNTKIALI